jgi:hypothetical protein
VVKAFNGLDALWSELMPRSTASTRSSIAGHLAIGISLGAGLALVLLTGSHPPFFQMLLNDSKPTLALALYIGVFAMTFGLGSTVTGLLLDATDEP